MWNSSAKPVARDTIEWQCNSWGSGRFGGDWLNWATFDVMIEAFGLNFWRDREGRDELVVAVPLDQFARIAYAIKQIGEEPESWPWFAEELDEDTTRQIDVEAQALGLHRTAVAENNDLLKALRIR